MRRDEIEELLEKALLDMREVARIFGVDPRTVERYIKQGKLEAIDIATPRSKYHRWRITSESVCEELHWEKPRELEGV